MAKQFDKGVRFYTSGIASVSINFPEDDISCHWCPHCRSESDLLRHWCRLTNNMIYNPYVIGLPETCPIKFEKGVVIDEGNTITETK